MPDFDFDSTRPIDLLVLASATLCWLCLFWALIVLGSLLVPHLRGIISIWVWT